MHAVCVAHDAPVNAAGSMDNSTASDAAGWWTPEVLPMSPFKGQTVRETH